MQIRIIHNGFRLDCNWNLETNVQSKLSQRPRAIPRHSRRSLYTSWFIICMMLALFCCLNKLFFECKNWNFSNIFRMLCDWNSSDFSGCAAITPCERSAATVDYTNTRQRWQYIRNRRFRFQLTITHECAAAAAGWSISDKLTPHHDRKMYASLWCRRPGWILCASSKSLYM